MTSVSLKPTGFFGYLSRYQGISMGTRLFLAIRWKLTPYFKMASKLPSEGTVLDLGCGHGLLSIALALQNPNRLVVGIDHDATRVSAAVGAARGVANLKFETGTVFSETLTRAREAFNGIAIIDVMHYFEPKLQNQIFANAWSALHEGGVLIVREVDPEGSEGKSFASKFNQLYEKVATLTGFTRAEKAGLHFRTQNQWIEELRSHGFDVTAESCSSVLFADILYVCRKKTRS